MVCKKYMWNSCAAVRFGGSTNTNKQFEQPGRRFFLFDREKIGHSLFHLYQIVAVFHLHLKTKIMLPINQQNIILFIELLRLLRNSDNTTLKITSGIFTLSTTSTKNKTYSQTDVSIFLHTFVIGLQQIFISILRIIACALYTVQHWESPATQTL